MDVESYNDNYTSLKLDHERFVSGHNGSNVRDVVLVASSAPLAVLCFQIAVLFFGCYGARSVKKSILEFVILIGVVLLSLTILAEFTIEFLCFICIFCLDVAFWLFEDHKANYIETIGDDDTNNDVKNYKQIFSPKPCFLSNYRAYVNIATSICILAVDFQVFPRRFCKTETFGTGLMDVGVGSFVVSNGIVSKEARGRLERNSLKALMRSILSTWPLILLGFVRLVTIKSVDYHEHVTEYGVHWNFFFTLTFIKIASSFIFSFVSPKYSLLLSLLTCGVYETLLTRGGLADYLLLDGNRSHPLHANREGICSCLGYLALYLVSVRLGMFLFDDSSPHHHHQQLTNKLTNKLLKLIFLNVFLWLVLYFYQEHITQVSRRMSNLPYSIWMMAYNIQLLSAFLFVDIVTSSLYRKLEKSEMQAGSSLLEAINSNGLFFFLLSNLLTGLINMSCDVIHVKDDHAMIILSSYMLCLCLVAKFLHNFNIKFKLW